MSKSNRPNYSSGGDNGHPTTSYKQSQLEKRPMGRPQDSTNPSGSNQGNSNFIVPYGAPAQVPREHLGHQQDLSMAAQLSAANNRVAELSKINEQLVAQLGKYETERRAFYDNEIAILESSKRRLIQAKGQSIYQQPYINDNRGDMMEHTVIVDGDQHRGQPRLPFSEVATNDDVKRRHGKGQAVNPSGVDSDDPPGFNPLRDQTPSQAYQGAQVIRSSSRGQSAQQVTQVGQRPHGGNSPVPTNTGSLGLNVLERRNSASGPAHPMTQVPAPTQPHQPFPEQNRRDQENKRGQETQRPSAYPRQPSSRQDFLSVNQTTRGQAEPQVVRVLDMGPNPTSPPRIEVNQLWDPAVQTNQGSFNNAEARRPSFGQKESFTFNPGPGRGEPRGMFDEVAPPHPPPSSKGRY
ncbi:hypothetical protein FRB94_013513 [Tulasnella sp. JGI-2019a]|nr:hypothetical protein FRB94_013513 [Tulasnella sp. JGI-2019a]